MSTNGTRITMDLPCRLSDAEREQIAAEADDLTIAINGAADMKRKGEPRALADVLIDVALAVQKLGGATDFGKGDTFSLLVELVKASSLVLSKDVKDKRAAQTACANIRKAGTRVQPVECIEKLDEPRGMVTTYRSDPRALWPMEHVQSNGQVDQRAMSPDEFQTHAFPLDDSPPVKASKKKN